MTLRRLIAASLLAIPPVVSAKDLSADVSSIANASGDDYAEMGPMVVEDGGRIVRYTPDARGEPNRVMIAGNRFAFDFLVIDRKLSTASVNGNVTVDADRLRIVANSASYTTDAKVRRFHTDHVRMGTPPIYVDARRVSFDTPAPGAGDVVKTTKVSVGTVKIHYSEPDLLGLNATASNLTYDSVEKRIDAEDVVFRFGPLPVFWLPSYSQTGMDGPAITPVDFQVGSNNRYGPYLRTTVLYTARKDIQPGLLLDGYGKAGVLIGPAVRYDTTKIVKGEEAPTYNVMKGDFAAAYINDHSNRGTDQFGQAIPEDRYFVDWRHKQVIDDKVEVTASIHAWSDPFAARDFRRRLFDREQQPDNFIEVVYPDSDFYASAFTRFQPNSWQDINQRLPEVRFDLNPREIADTRIYQRGYVSVGYLREETSDELIALPGTTGSSLATPRVDAYYGLTRPVKPDAAFTFTPVAGVRSTTWFDAVNGDPTYSRLAGQLGFDAQAQAEGRWNYENTVWEVNGLRHKLRPVVQYRYMPGAVDGAGRIPNIDRWSFLTAPPPIDISQRRDTDELHETQVLRLGLENLFQTRDKEYGSRDLVGFDVYQDIRDTNNPEDPRTLSDTYLRQTLTPAPWLDWQLYERVSPYTGALHQIATVATIADGDRWKATVGYQYACDVPQLDPLALAAGVYQYGADGYYNQLILGWQYRINAQYRFRALWRVDLDNGSLAEQTYGVSQQLGHSWQIEYTVGDNRNARGDSGLNFGVRLRLNTF